MPDHMIPQTAIADTQEPGAMGTSPVWNKNDVAAIDAELLSEAPASLTADAEAFLENSGPPYYSFPGWNWVKKMWEKMHGAAH